MSRWLVTGGAGYIGAHVIRVLENAGFEPVVLDDMSTGVPAKVPSHVPIHRASVLDTRAVQQVLDSERIDGVVHLAAKKSASESVTQPWLYYRENVEGMLSLLAAMRAAGVRRLVYSSSAAVYGNQDRDPILETFPLSPQSPYGETKVIGEWLARSAGATDSVSWAALRYFNVAGAAERALGDIGVANLIPMVFEAIDAGRDPQIFGADYATPDGTCIRDFVHVSDLAEAHAAAAAYVMQTQADSVLNVGRGHGSSVRDIMSVVAEVTGVPLRPQVAPRRPGDIVTSVAGVDLIGDVLGWRATRDLRAMVESAWQAWRYARGSAT